MRKAWKWNGMALAALMAGSLPLQAAIVVQELFDGAPADANIDGWGGSSTAVGQTGNWAASGSTGQFTANNFNIDGSTLPGLPSNAGSQGGVWNNTASWNTGIYAMRPLVSTIDFAADQTLFFSVRLRNHGDTAMGIGLASGTEFVGAGFSWNTFTGGSGNAAYITHGLFTDTQGVYAQDAAEAAGSVDGYGLLVGRITMSSSGSDLIDIVRYAENETIDDLGDVVWSAQSSVDSSMSASNLLLWMNGSGGGELDAIRIGETWMDVTGIPEPATFGLLAAFGGGLLFIRRKLTM